MTDAELEYAAVDFAEGMKKDSNRRDAGVHLWTAWALVEAFKAGAQLATPFADQPLLMAEVNKAMSKMAERIAELEAQLAAPAAQEPPTDTLIDTAIWHLKGSDADRALARRLIRRVYEGQMPAKEPRNPDEIACSSCGLTMAESYHLYLRKAQPAPAQGEPDDKGKRIAELEAEAQESARVIVKMSATIAELKQLAAPAEVVAALRDLLAWAESAEVQIEGEWGAGRSLAQLEEKGMLSSEIVRARNALKTDLR